MHKDFDTTHDRDFPLTKTTLQLYLDLIEDTVEALAGSGLGSNTLVILSGVEASGGSHTAGWVIINGELLPFEAGVDQATVIIEETITQAPWQETGGSIVDKDTYIERVAKFGTGTTTYTFANFKRLELARQTTILGTGYGYLGSGSNPLDAAWSGAGNETIVTKDQFNWVHIMGQIQYTGSTGAIAAPVDVATLDSAYWPTRPSGLSLLYFKMIDLTNYNEILCTLNTSDGTIQAIDGTLTNSNYYYLNLKHISE